MTLEPSTTALLILDMQKRNCGVRPLHGHDSQREKAVLRGAASGVMLWYSLGSLADLIDLGFMPREGEWMRPGGPNKFLGSNLEEKLKAGGIKTAIVCGTSFQGVGIGTGSGLAQRGYKVIVPIDCLSSEDPYEQYSAWQFFKGGWAVVTMNSALTRSIMVKFGN